VFGCARLLRNSGILLLFLTVAGGVRSEAVTGQDFSKNRSGYPCFSTLKVGARERVTLKLSDYEGVWSIRFHVSDQVSTYRHFFNNHGLRDKEAFESAFSSVVVGDQSFDFSDVALRVVQQKNLVKETFAAFDIEERHNVVPVLNAMKIDGIKISGLIDLKETAGPLSEFRTCSYAAMGLQEGDRIKTDFRAEYRMIFDDAFEAWIASMSKAEICRALRFDGEAVDEVVDSAATAFYPGILNFNQRKQYRKRLEGSVPIAKLSGLVEAKKSCLMAKQLVEISRIPVDQALLATEKLD
jgi:hypothetical protein